MENISPTVLWAVFGLFLIVTEIFTATFFLLFFGVAALVVALAKLLGLDHFNTELLLFSVIGFAGIFTFRKKILTSFQSPDQPAMDQNESLVLSETVPAGLEAQIDYQGSKWTAYNPTEVDMLQGRRVFIDRTQGSKLVLKHSE